MQSYSLKSKQKKKSEQSSVSSGRSALNERLAFEAVSREIQVLRLREILVLSGFILGAAGLRATMQFLPSVEPLTFFAMLSGFLFGKKKGFIAGASSLYLSNFLVFGGQGPWTLFQALGFGIAGFLGGFLKGNPGRIGKAALFAKVIFISFIST
ncbi:MAG: hypothetical protein NTV63_02520, partial [Candidatus Woesearchaeota archaeon]|nr:hypothetical protein [Candidatus Woesearchaeota archaeon]